MRTREWGQDKVNEIERLVNEGKTEKEISEITGLTVGTVKYIKRMYNICKGWNSETDKILCKMIDEGKTIQEIAKRLQCSERMVIARKEKIYSTPTKVKTENKVKTESNWNEVVNRLRKKLGKEELKVKKKI